MSDWTGELEHGIWRERSWARVAPRPAYPEKFAEAPSDDRLAEIEGRARANFGLRTWGNLLDGLDDVVMAIQDDVPRLLAEARRLRARLEAATRLLHGCRVPGATGAEQELIREVLAALEAP